MKGTFAKGCKTLIAAFVLLAAMFLTANRAEAQQLSESSAPAGWKPVDAVKQVCVSQVEYWQGYLGQYAPGTSNAINVTRHVSFYKAAYGALEQGESVPTAITVAMETAVPVGTADSGTTPKTVRGLFHQEAVELFRVQ